MHNPAGLKEARKSPLKLTLKGPKSPTCSQPQKAQQAPLLASAAASTPRHAARAPGRAGSRSWSLRLRIQLHVLRGLSPQTLKHAVPKARRAWASPSGATGRVAFPARPPALSYLPGAPGSSSVGAARVAQLRSRRGSLGLFPLPSAPSLTTSPPLSHHVRTSGPLWEHSSPTPRRALGAGGRLVATRVSSVRSGRCVRPGPGSPELPALNEPLARSIVAPQGSIRQNWTTMWRLPLARGDSPRSDWPGPRPGSPSFYSVRKIRNSARSAECLRDGRGRQGRSARGGALQMS